MYSQEQLQALKDALANGALRVKFADRDVQYRSIDELKQAIATVEQEMAAANGTKVRRQIRVYTEKGV
jgi:hypothetical protein